MKIDGLDEASKSRALSLARGAVQAVDGKDKHFLLVWHGTRKPSSPLERALLVYCQQALSQSPSDPLSQRTNPGAASPSLNDDANDTGLEGNSAGGENESIRSLAQSERHQSPVSSKTLAPLSTKAVERLKAWAAGDKPVVLKPLNDKESPKKTGKKRRILQAEKQEIKDRERRKLIKKRRSDAQRAQRAQISANYRKAQEEEREQERTRKEAARIRFNELLARQSNGSISRSELLELWPFREQLSPQVRETVRKTLITEPDVPHFVAPPPPKEKFQKFDTCPVCGGDGGAAGQCYKCQGVGWI